MITTSDVGVANLAFLEELFAPLTDNPFFIKNEKLQYVAANDAMLRLCGVANRRELLASQFRSCARAVCCIIVLFS